MEVFVFITLNWIRIRISLSVLNKKDIFLPHIPSVSSLLECKDINSLEWYIVKETIATL